MPEPKIFHEHLDRCEQCRNHPFDLCQEGHLLLHAAALAPEGTVVVKIETPGKCDLCGEEEELRPYGPNGENVCFKCGMKDIPAAEKALKKRFGIT